MIATAASRNGTAALNKAEPWQRQSVRQFFESVSWEGPQLQQVNVQTSSASSAPMRLSISVQTFFDNFPWDGSPEIAVPMAPLSQPPEPAAEDDTLTLDAFSELF
jgi:hypothetical protein